MRGGEQDPRHAVAVEPRRHDVSRPVGHRAHEGEGVDAVGLHARPAAPLGRLQGQLCLVLLAGPVDQVGLGPGLVEVCDAGQELVLLVAPEPLVWVVGAYGLGASDDDGVVGGWELEVVVVYV